MSAHLHSHGSRVAGGSKITHGRSKITLSRMKLQRHGPKHKVSTYITTQWSS
jgi:hypothetical protein